MNIGPCEGYIFKIRSLVVLQEFEVDGSSSGIQENLRIRLEPMIEMPVEGEAY